MNPLVNTAYLAIRWYIGTDSFDRVSAMVRNLIFADMPGADKKQAVIDAFWAEVEALRKGPAGVLIDGIIFLTRLRFEK